MASFRLNAKHLFLTYPQADELQRDVIVPHMEKIFGHNLLGGIVASELHADNHRHYHVYVSLGARIDWKGPDSMRAFDINGHHPNIQACRSPNAVAKYCMKENDYFFFGSVEIKEMLKNKLFTRKEVGNMLIKGTKTLPQIVDEQPSFIFGYNNLRRDVSTFKLDTMLPRTGTRTCLWIYGSSGVGKTRLAREYPGPIYIKSVNKWWDGYVYQPTVILDDLDISHSFIGYHLKIWADRYETYGETKGGHIPLNHDRFIVTSQYSIETIWNDQETRDAIRRRFKVIHLIKFDGTTLKWTK